MLGAAAGEAAQDLLGLGGPEPERGRVLDQLVVLLGDQLPADGASEDLLEAFVACPVERTVKRRAADVLQPWEQPEAEQVAEREPDDGGAVGVGVVVLDLSVGAVAKNGLAWV